jgi:hypothetical protein
MNDQASRIERSDQTIGEAFFIKKREKQKRAKTHGKNGSGPGNDMVN